MYCVSFDVVVGNKLYLILSYLILLEGKKNNVLGYTCFDLSKYCVKYD